MNTLQNAAIAYIRKLFQEQAGSHDLSHSMRVYRMAMTIADREPDCDREVVALAALLHDADDPKLFDTRDNANCRGDCPDSCVWRGTWEIPSGLCPAFL